MSIKGDWVVVVCYWTVSNEWQVDPSKHQSGKRIEMLLKREAKVFKIKMNAV